MKAGNIMGVLSVLSMAGGLGPQLRDILQEEISLPNLPMPTIGGQVFWNTIAECNGWKLQQNMMTHHARILNDHDIRIAWGTIAGMEKALERMEKYIQDAGQK